MACHPLLALLFKLNVTKYKEYTKQRDILAKGEGMVVVIVVFQYSCTKDRFGQRRAQHLFLHASSHFFVRLSLFPSPCRWSIILSTPSSPCPSALSLISLPIRGCQSLTISPLLSPHVMTPLPSLQEATLSLCFHAISPLFYLTI